MVVSVLVFVVGFLGIGGQDLPPTICPYKDVAFNTSIFQLLLMFLARLLSVVCHCFLSDQLPYQQVIIQRDTECTCYENLIECDDRYLKAIPQRNINSNFYMAVLDLDDNQLTKIPAGSLPTNLSSLSLDRNPIESIDDSAFDESINTLQTISIYGATFTQLPTAFFHLKQLTGLNIYQTNILTWDNNAMMKLAATLQYLSMDTVGLTEWPVWLKSCSHLTELGITGCSISSLPDDALDMAANTLQGLALSNNHLTRVPKAISKLAVLSTLALDQNRITDITWLPQLTSLTQLNLSGNRISNASQLSSAIRFYSNTIYNFGIDKNFLTSIPDMSFLTLMTVLDYTNNHISDPNSGAIPGNLTDLNLENNFLPTIPRIFKSMQSVPTLDLTYNRILSLQGTDFPTSVTGVDLGHNLITELTDTSFPSNSSIQYLLLPYNPLSKISHSAFQNLPQLRELNMKYSKLTRLPLGIARMDNLISIDVSGSAGLVCTCLEKGLESKIGSLMPDNVVGDCGKTSLYMFFKELSPECPEV